MNNNNKKCKSSLYVREPNMEAKNSLENTGHLCEKNKLINYLDVSDMSNIHKLKTQTLSGYYT